MTRQRRLAALYTAQRTAEVNQQLKQYIADRERINNQTEHRIEQQFGERGQVHSVTVPFDTMAELS